MSKIAIQGNASGSGTFTIESPNTNTNYTLSLPEEAGTITTSNSPYSTFRNRIINGDMRIDQRNAGAAVTTSASFPVDRWKIINTTDGAFSAQQDSSAPTGFVNSTKVTVTTADASVGSTQQFRFQQFIEGTNVSDLAWGSASAKTITLSFWVRSSVTGTFGGSLNNSAEDRSYPFSYSISAADTWEYKTVTVAGDTTGTWLTTTGTGIELFFGLSVGADRSGTAGAWAGAHYTSATGATNLISTLNATWYITGVQLEVGSVATPFERRPYGQELSLCQRYCYVATSEFMGVTVSGNVVSGAYYLPVPMRIAPTFSNITFSANAGNNGVAAVQTITTRAAQIYNSSNNWTTNANILVSLTASAEL